jgi:multicomponent Na+:H+ antiporter subunit D
LIQAGLQIEQYGIVASALAVSMLTLFSMTKIWAEVFWKEAAAGFVSESAPRSLPAMSGVLLFGPVVLMAGFLVLIGIAAEPVFAFATRAAQQLIDPAEYVHAVLGAQK